MLGLFMQYIPKFPLFQTVTLQSVVMVTIEVDLKSWIMVISIGSPMKINSISS